ncbi:hypothetical protein DZ860_04900 [Vibrio sinensis]|uniref:Uncharacterized protein n=1 Tax=Vibrio sinensis TaxID=2302434 RepID=A0A3A6QV25_9VIBR|nr:hypothetical protein DZ860_04900 [Vibrio sinensis]
MFYSILIGDRDQPIENRYKWIKKTRFNVIDRQPYGFNVFNEKGNCANQRYRVFLTCLRPTGHSNVVSIWIALRAKKFEVEVGLSECHQLIRAFPIHIQT